MLKMSEVVSGMQVRHMESGEVFSVAGVPFWFDGELTVTLHDHKGHARMTRLCGLEAVIENTEEESK